MARSSHAKRSDQAFRLAGGNVATGVAFIARVEGARTPEEARKKLASIVGVAGAMPLWTRDSSVQVRVYFNPDLARIVNDHEVPVEIDVPEHAPERPKLGV